MIQCFSVNVCDKARRAPGASLVALQEQARLGLLGLGVILESEGLREQPQALEALGIQALLEIPGQEVIQDQSG